MKIFNSSVIFVSMILLIVGCAKVDKLDAYKDATLHDKPLILPPGIDKDAFENHYSIPKVGKSEHSVDVPLTPPKSV